MATVLVVDDEPGIRDLIALNLQLEGHDVLTAGDGDEALRVIGESSPDLILLDVMMPGRDGYSVLSELKASGPEQAAIPVVMVTARGDRLDRIRGGIEGAIHYIAKPFSVVELCRCVDEVLAGGPEGAQRHAAQTRALVELARAETGPVPAGTAAPARPRLTRLEPAGAGARTSPTPRRVIDRARCTPRQNEVLDAVVAHANLSEAARVLGVSRTYLYTSLHRVAQRCGEPSGPELAKKLRSGALGLSDP